VNYFSLTNCPLVFKRIESLDHPTVIAVSVLDQSTSPQSARSVDLSLEQALAYADALQRLAEGRNLP
jgi:hypothetical protein